MGFKTNFWKIFGTLDQVLVVQASTQGFLENLILKMLFGQNIFIQKYYPVLNTWHDHWAYFLSKERKYRSWRFEMIFKSTWKQQAEIQIKIRTKPNQHKSFCWVQFLGYINLNDVPPKSGCDRSTPLTRISSPRFLN